MRLLADTRRHQYLAWKRQVDRTRRIRAGNLEGTGDRFAKLVRTPDLVFPFNIIADDTVLVALLLKPVDICVTGTANRWVGCVGGAAGADEDGGASALSIVEHRTEILRADINMNKHGLGTAACSIEAMGCG
jgi:hypothetical protein